MPVQSWNVRIEERQDQFNKANYDYFTWSARAHISACKMSVKSLEVGVDDIGVCETRQIFSDNILKLFSSVFKIVI